MKKFFKLAAIACAAVLFVSCGAKDDKSLIQEVMESYMSASLSMDYAKLKSIVTPESAAAIDQMEQMMKNLPEEAVKAAQEAAKNVKTTFDAESIVINGETATAKLNTMGMDVPMSLKKVDGSWLIDLVGAAGAAAAQEEEEIIESIDSDSTAVEESTEEVEEKVEE